MKNVTCPVCQLLVPNELINAHLDSNCSKYKNGVVQSLSSNTESKRKPVTTALRQATLTRFLGPAALENLVPLGYFCLYIINKPSSTAPSLASNAGTQKMEQNPHHRQVREYRAEFVKSPPRTSKLLHEFTFKSISGNTYTAPFHLCVVALDEPLTGVDRSGNQQIFEEYADITREIGSLFETGSLFTTTSTSLYNGDIPSEPYRNYPAMKSHLQKAIRRQRTMEALLSAIHLIRMDPNLKRDRSNQSGCISNTGLAGMNQLLRRIGIIMVEDVKLSRDYPVIAWLTIFFSKLESAGKKQHQSKSRNKPIGSLLSLSRVELLHLTVFVLGFVERLCDTAERDPVDSAKFYRELSSMHKQRSSPANVDTVQPSSSRIKPVDTCNTMVSFKLMNSGGNNGISAEERTLLYCLYLRAEYGGMACDTEMLTISAAIWFNRFVAKKLAGSKEICDPIPRLKSIITQNGIPCEISELKVVPGILDSFQHGRIPQLPRTGWVKAAIDFHVSSAAYQLATQMSSDDLDLLHADNYLGENEEVSAVDLVSSLLWNQSSSVNTRKSVGYENASCSSSSNECIVWKKYEKRFEEFAQKFINDLC